MGVERLGLDGEDRSNAADHCGLRADETVAGARILPAIDLVQVSCSRGTGPASHPASPLISYQVPHAGRKFVESRRVEAGSSRRAPGSETGNREPMNSEPSANCEAGLSGSIPNFPTSCDLAMQSLALRAQRECAYLVRVFLRLFLIANNR